MTTIETLEAVHPIDPIVHTCSCGKRHTAIAWILLPLCGYWVPNGTVLESRHCSCGSTRSRDLGDKDSLYLGHIALLRGGVRRWEKSVNSDKWHARLGLHVDPEGKWTATVAWNSKTGTQSVGGQGEGSQPRDAVDNAVERLVLPDDFLAAIGRL